MKILAPPGYLALRDAIVRTAEARTPDVAVRGYLERTRKPDDTVSSRWDMWRSPDPWLADADLVVRSEGGDHAIGTILLPSGQHSAEWLALASARASLRQALADGYVLAILEGEASGPSQAGQRLWRLFRGEQALLTGTMIAVDRGPSLEVFVETASLDHWLNPSIVARATATTAVQRPLQVEVDGWVEEQLIRGEKHAAIIAACTFAALGSERKQPTADQVRAYFKANPGKRGRRPATR